MTYVKALFRTRRSWAASKNSLAVPAGPSMPALHTCRPREADHEPARLANDAEAQPRCTDCCPFKLELIRPRIQRTDDERDAGVEVEVAAQLLGVATRILTAHRRRKRRLLELLLDRLRRQAADALAARRCRPARGDRAGAVGPGAPVAQGTSGEPHRCRRAPAPARESRRAPIAALGTQGAASLGRAVCGCQAADLRATRTRGPRPRRGGVPAEGGVGT